MSKMPQDRAHSFLATPPFCLLLVVVCQKLEKGVDSMTEQTLAHLSVYKGWDTYQGLLLKVVEPLSRDQLALRAAPQLRSIGENAAHIVGTRAGWLHYNLERGDENMVALA